MSDQQPLFAWPSIDAPEPALVVNVHFDDLQGLEEFADLTGLPIHERTRIVWYEPSDDDR